MRKGLFVALALVLLAGLAFVLLRPAPPPPPPIVQPPPPVAEAASEPEAVADAASEPAAEPVAMVAEPEPEPETEPAAKQRRRAKPPPPPPMDDLEAMRKWIAEAMRKVVPVSRQCYQQALPSRPELRDARLAYALTLVARDGRKAALRERDFQGDASTDSKLRDCMLQALNRADFQLPTSHPEMQVIYPLMFE